MKYIRKYDSDSAFDADSSAISALDSDSLSLVGAQRIETSGRNVVVPMIAAVRGDIAVYDKVDGKRKVVRCRTFDRQALDSRYIVGECVCVGRRGNKMLFVHKTDGGNQDWGQGYQVAIDGIDLAGGGSFTFTATSRATVTDVTVTYPANSTYASVAALINAVCGGYWRAYAYSTGVYMEHDDYTGGVLTISASSPTLTLRDITPMKYQLEDTGLQWTCNRVLRVKGLYTSFGGCVFNRFKEYYSANGLSDANLSEYSPYMLKESAFNTTDNPTIYNKYNGDYDAYLRDEMLLSATGRGAMTDWVDNGSVLAAVTYANAENVQRPAYPAAYAAKQLGLAVSDVVTGFEVGAYHLPDTDELWRLMHEVVYPFASDDGEDDLNYGIVQALGGERIYGDRHYWASSQYDRSTAWFYHGDRGAMHYYDKFYSGHARGLVAFEI